MIFAVDCRSVGECVYSAKVIQVIETKSTRGKGTDADPVRQVTQYWDFEGNLLFGDREITGKKQFSERTVDSGRDSFKGCIG